MAAPPTTICAPWASVTQARLCDDCATADGYVLTQMVGVASDLLYKLSGRQFPGSCSETVRPCSVAVGTSSVPNWHGTALGDGGYGSWLPLGVCGCNRLVTACRCNSLSQLRLPGYPVTGVSEVKVDGVALNAAQYRVDDYQFLVRLPDVGSTDRESWPCCQRLDLPDTAEDTFSVTYTWGAAAPPAGVRAAALLACELALACEGSDCQLPDNVTQVVREGRVDTYADPFALWSSGMTGIRVVDLFLASVNPHRLRQDFEVGSPDADIRPTQAGT